MPTPTQQTPEQILAAIAAQTPQFPTTQVPAPVPIPSDLTGGAGIGAVFTPQFADNLALSAITGHPGQNGLSAVLGSLVAAHQQRSAENASLGKQRTARRGSLLSQHNSEVTQAQKGVDIQQRAATSLMRGKSGKARTEAFQNQVDATIAATQARERVANNQLDSKVTVAKVNAGVKADERQAKAASIRLKQHRDRQVAQTTSAQKAAQGLRKELGKQTKQTAGLDGSPVPFTPVQQAANQDMYRRVVAADNALVVANARAAVTDHLLALGTDVFSSEKLATLPTAIWSADEHGNAQQTVTVLDATPTKVTFAITDANTNNVQMLDASVASPNGLTIMRRLQGIPSLGLSFSLPQVGPPPPLSTQQFVGNPPQTLNTPSLPLPPNTGTNLLRQ